MQSGDEEENVLYTARAKLFVRCETLLDEGTGIKNWIERGVGDVRILQHRTTGHFRILMRQEKILKTLCNHQIDTRMKLTANVGTDRSWVWQALDYSDGLELVDTTFAIRFKDSAVANAFKKTFEKCQEEIHGDADAAETIAGDATAEAIASDAMAEAFVA